MIPAGNDASRMLKKATFSPTQPRRAETCLGPGKAAANRHFIGVGGMIPTARVQRGPS